MTTRKPTPTQADDYRAFLAAKVATAPRFGFDLELDQVSDRLLPHARAIVPWLAVGGRRALFASFGLAKTSIQLELSRIIAAREQRPALIIAPLGVRQEFRRDATEILGWAEGPRFIRSTAEVEGPGVYLTNYETMREGKLDPAAFVSVCLDEASILRGMGGTKTFREAMKQLAGDDGTGARGEAIPYRFVATATPDPNEHLEILAYAEFLGVMEIGEAKTRWFKRDSTQNDNLTLHPHKEEEFWHWVATWALFVSRPSDLGFSDVGYELPNLTVRWHELPSDHRTAGTEADGQGKMFQDAAAGVVPAAAEKRRSLPARVAKLMELVAQAGPNEPVILWCDLNDEQTAIERGLATLGGTVSSLTGSQALEEREALMDDWRTGRTMALLTKPIMYGAGVNLQRAHRAIFVGIGHKFQDIIQAVHRIHRFQQTQDCTVDFIYTEAERSIRRDLEAKWKRHTAKVARMTALVRTLGLAQLSMAQTLIRTTEVQRQEVAGTGFRLICGDSIEETRQMAADSVGLIVTSIPFGNQYEYSPSVRDLGHTNNDAHFFENLSFLTAELYRVLQPGRIAAIHVKDRIVPGGINKLGFQTVNPFSDKTVAHFQDHGFGFLGRKTVVTDVVRENNQTYRLGWTEQCKDGSRMGVGMPEYVLLFRKPPTDRSNGYADVPVVKDKAEYSLARWQVDAHGFARSSGNRHLSPDEIADLPHEKVYKLFKRYSLETTYDFERHVALGEALAARKRLPTTFMILPPASWHPDVWADVTRMRTLNSSQKAQGREMHLCPLQFDIADRLIIQLSNPGDVVYDPFAGIGTVPLRAMKAGRQGLGVELSPRYFADAVEYCRKAAAMVELPDLFAIDEDAA